MTNSNMMENVTEIIKISEKTNVNDVINSDLNKQQDDFKKKLMEKRRKSALSEIGDNANVNRSVNILFFNK